MTDYLGLEWTRDAMTKQTVGTLTDAHGRRHQIGTAAWKDGHFFVGTMVLTPEMCMELALVLGFIGYAKELPRPEGNE
jgi:hypothetical protein